jgi:phosphomannomutase
MVTASHNPPADNGYKVYLGTGAQIVPPADVDIAALIDLVDATDVPLADADDPLIERLDDAPLEAYLASVPAVRLLPDLPGVPVAYTAMHGVGGETLLRAFDAAGYPAPAVTELQQQPDPDFPTVSFPNPEEPGAMDLLLAEAARASAVIAIANDPDADRLGAAIPIRSGGWRRLTGDEIGWLLADHILANTSGDDRVVITTLVSSSLLAKMAAAAGVHHAETFTGFKWIAHEVLTHPELRFVLGYEQALGYLVTGQPLDKDGITAAVMLTEVAAAAVADGRTVEDLLDGIAERFGRYVTGEKSVRMQPVEAQAGVAALQAEPPTELNGAAVTSVQWFGEANLLRLMIDTTDGPMRVQIRPSGTEPKVKLYGEAVGADPGPYLDALAVALAEASPH